jgi:hypothetical protein
VSKLSYETGLSLRGALLWASDDQGIEADIELGRIDPDELDSAVEATAVVLEKLRNLRTAANARTEASRR